jgi:cyclic pyranopterin phosphate synthase
LLRSGASDSEIERALREAVWHKELKHFIGDKRFRRTARSMSMIGG